jgi:hypothetical protein
MGIMSYISAKKKEFRTAQHEKRIVQLKALEEKTKIETEKVKVARAKQQVRKLKKESFRATPIGRAASALKSHFAEQKRKRGPDFYTSARNPFADEPKKKRKR